MHGPVAILAKFAHDVTSGVNTRARLVAARASQIDRIQLLKGAMLVSLAIGGLTPIVFAGSTIMVPIANTALMTFTGLLVVTILI